MKTLIANLSILFRSSTGEEHFLFQGLNVGTLAKDQLKFVFSDPDSGIGGTYQASPGRLGDGDVIRLVPEVTYHYDGSLLFKLPSYRPRTRTEYRNPQQKDFRRTPLDSIGSWEGFLLYRVHRYDLCKKKAPSNPVFLEKRCRVREPAGLYPADERHQATSDVSGARHVGRITART